LTATAEGGFCAGLGVAARADATWLGAASKIVATGQINPAAARATSAPAPSDARRCPGVRTPVHIRSNRPLRIGDSTQR